MRGASERVAVHAYSSDLNTISSPPGQLHPGLMGFFFLSFNLCFFFCVVCLLFGSGCPFAHEQLTSAIPSVCSGAHRELGEEKTFFRNSSHMSLIGPRPDHS